jgi:hypothetical protein
MVKQSKEDTRMPDAIARKRLKKKMLDRWENEGGRIATNTTNPVNGPTNEDKDHAKKLSSPSDNSMGGTASPTKRHKRTGK